MGNCLNALKSGLHSHNGTINGKYDKIRIPKAK